MTGNVREPGGPALNAAIRPDFEKCRACGADAAKYVYWNPTGGWACTSCGGADYEEAAE